jgi:hypothetical protein
MVYWWWSSLWHYIWWAGTKCIEMTHAFIWISLLVQRLSGRTLFSEKLTVFNDKINSIHLVDIVDHFKTRFFLFDLSLLKYRLRICPKFEVEFTVTN